MKKRIPDVDFSKHVLTEKRSEGLLVHKFGVPGSSIYMVKFINTEGILAVTGDLGNWIFCREFHPSEEGEVSDGYWCEKLRISSKQNPYEWDAQATSDEIDRLLKEEEDLTPDEIEYLNDLKRHTDEHELDYTHFAYRESVGRFQDGEYVPFVKSLNVQLAIVFDAFDEICRRMKESVSLQQKHE